MNPAAERFRAAVEAGLHAEASTLLKTYCRELENTLAALPPQSLEAAQLCQQSRELLEWARRMTLAARSRLEHGRRTLPRRCPYVAATQIRRTWSLEA